MNEPLVTCLCLTTAGRGTFLKRAIQCFLDQTYQGPKELMIVADSVAEVESIQTGRDGMIVEHETRFSCLVVGPHERTIGRKRNLGCRMAEGEIIAIWDDDDYSSPGRLEFQVQSLQVSRKVVTGFQVMKFTDGSSWWQYCAPLGIVVGSSLCFRRDWWDASHPNLNPDYQGGKYHHFPEVQVGEDTGFCKIAADEGELVLCADMDLMYATIHGGNTSLKRPSGDPGWIPLPGFDGSVFHRGQTKP